MSLRPAVAAWLPAEKTIGTSKSFMIWRCESIIVVMPRGMTPSAGAVVPHETLMIALFCLLLSMMSWRTRSNTEAESAVLNRILTATTRALFATP